MNVLARRSKFLLVALYLASFNHAALRHDYLTVSWHSVILTTLGGRVESSSGLAYENNMNCTYTVKVPSGKQISLRFLRFELESKLQSACVDYVNIHEGDSLRAVTLNTEPLCGKRLTLGTFTTTGCDVMLHFVTDSSAVYRGFDLVYHAFSAAPCEGQEFTCDDAMCIDGSLTCDDVIHCDDGSDETPTLCSTAGLGSAHLPAAAIFGLLAAGVVLLVILPVLVYKVTNHVRWRAWLRETGAEGGPWGAGPWGAGQPGGPQATNLSPYPINNYQLSRTFNLLPRDDALFRCERSNDFPSPKLFIDTGEQTTQGPRTNARPF